MAPRMWTGISDSVIEEDFALPSQFHRLWHESRAITPERALAMSVLWQALLDLHKFRFAPRRRQQRMFWEAYEWVASEDRSWPYSFGSLCDSLSLDAGAVREMLLSVQPPTAAAIPGELDEAA